MLPDYILAVLTHQNNGVKLNLFFRLKILILISVILFSCTTEPENDSKDYIDFIIDVEDIIF